MIAAPDLTLELGLARGSVRALGGVTQKDMADIVRACCSWPSGTKGQLRPFQQCSAVSRCRVVAFDLPPPHPGPLGWTVFKEAAYRNK